MSRFVRNPAGLRELARSAALAAVQQEVGEQVIARAKADSTSHQFSASLTVLARNAGPDGTIVSVGSKWPFAHLIEWGSVNNPPQAPLRKAASSLHLHFKED
jgi:hypothetical protein